MTMLLQTLVVLLVAPLTVGLVRKCKARFQNRRGASIFQPYSALLALMKKDMTITRYSSWVFRSVPFVVFGCALVLAALAPTLAHGTGSVFDNLFLIAGILALGSVFLVFGGMDTASTFGNMGSSREMTIAALVEPALFTVFASLGLLASSWGMGDIAAFFANSTWVAVVPIASITLVGLLFVVLAENARYPVDNPATHLELTMVHEAMVLEYSGPYLALLEYASAVKLTVLGVFLVTLALPIDRMLAALPLGAAALIALLIKILVTAFAIAFIESTIVKMRFYRMQEYMSLAFLFAVGGCVLIVISKYLGLV